MEDSFVKNHARLWFMLVILISAMFVLVITSNKGERIAEAVLQPTSTVTHLDSTPEVPPNYIFDIIVKRQSRLDPLIARQIAFTVAKYAEKYSYPPELILAIMKRESEFLPTVVSSANCKGLMQINPPKHLEKLKARGLKGEDDPKIFYIDTNVDIGCEIFQEYYRNAKGDARKALKRYVGGKHDGYLIDVLAEFTSLMLAKHIKPSIEKEPVKSTKATAKKTTKK